MRLYHFNTILLLACVLLLIGAGCTPSDQPVVQDELSIQLDVDGEQISVQVPAGSTAAIVLETAGIALEGNDRSEPAPGITLTEDTLVRVIRVEEIIETEQEVIPFEVIRQPTENLPTGQEKLLQAGKNGIKEIISVRVFENGEEISFSEVSSLDLEETVNEIILVGMQSSIAPIGLPSPLVYLSNGNAWIMEQSTSNRSLLVATGDLDGRVFSLSPDGEWLLFTRIEDDEDLINSLWAVAIDSPEDSLIYLDTDNVIHYAGWVPGIETKFAFSSVEPRISAPGWQANNDLVLKIFSENGWTSRVNTLQETNYGGVYGWWGTDFQFSPQGDFVAYASPDQIGIIPYEEAEKEIFLDLIPYKTQGDWAWMPGIGVGPLGNVIFSVNHALKEGSLAAEESPVFDLVAIPLTGGGVRTIVNNVGMFAYPLPSPVTAKPSGEASYQIAFLQAIFPEQSSTSNYRVGIMDRDGSNQELIFPAPTSSGLQPSRGWGAWSPLPIEDSGNYPLAVIYENNIWILDPETGYAWQVTGDGRVSSLDW
ncbi:MAG: G5 domain-containing protein [Chloroflexi bacterium]|nr:G5 domain-containing protein [Chloroflexota bacterium]